MMLPDRDRPWVATGCQNCPDSAGRLERIVGRRLRAVFSSVAHPTMSLVVGVLGHCVGCFLQLYPPLS